MSCRLTFEWLGDNQQRDGKTILQFIGAIRSQRLTSKLENGVLSLSIPKVEVRNNSEKKTIMIKGEVSGFSTDGSQNEAGGLYSIFPVDIQSSYCYNIPIGYHNDRKSHLYDGLLNADGIEAYFSKYFL